MSLINSYFRELLIAFFMPSVLSNKQERCGQALESTSISIRHFADEFIRIASLKLRRSAPQIRRANLSHSEKMIAAFKQAWEP